MAPPDFVALIPARLASARLPDKPLADIGGKPMVVRVAERAAAAGAARVAVATDSPRIAAAVSAAGFEAILTREDHASGTDRLAEAAGRLGLPAGQVVVNVQGDEPLIPPSLVRAVAARLAGATDCAIATAAHPIEALSQYLDPNVVKVVCDRELRALYFSRAPIPFERDAMTGFPQQLPARLPGGLRARGPAVAPHRAVRLPRGLPRRLSAPCALAARGARVARATARALARAPHRGAARRTGAAAGRRHGRRSRARALNLRSHASDPVKLTGSRV